MLKPGRKIVTILEIVKTRRRKIRLRRRYQWFLEFVQTAEATSNHGKTQGSIVGNCEHHTRQEQDRTAALPSQGTQCKGRGADQHLQQNKRHGQACGPRKDEESPAKNLAVKREPGRERWMRHKARTIRKLWMHSWRRPPLFRRY